MRTLFGAVAFLTLTLSCAGQPKNISSNGDASVAGKNGQTEYFATATKLGSALHLELYGTRRTKEVMRDFENAALWEVKVIMPNKNIELKKVTKGSVRVERVDVDDGEYFDTRLKMSMGFAMPVAVNEIWVDIQSPGSKVERFYVDVEKSRVAAGR